MCQCPVLRGLRDRVADSFPFCVSRVGSFAPVMEFPAKGRSAEDFHLIKPDDVQEQLQFIPSL